LTGCQVAGLHALRGNVINTQQIVFVNILKGRTSILKGRTSI